MRSGKGRVRHVERACEVNDFTPEVSVWVLAPYVKKIMEKIDKIPLTMKTHDAWLEARSAANELDSFITAIARQIKAEELRQGKKPTAFPKKSENGAESAAA